MISVSMLTEIGVKSRFSLIASEPHESYVNITEIALANLGRMSLWHRCVAIWLWPVGIVAVAGVR